MPQKEHSIDINIPSNAVHSFFECIFYTGWSVFILIDGSFRIVPNVNRPVYFCASFSYLDRVILWANDWFQVEAFVPGSCGYRAI